MTGSIALGFGLSRFLRASSSDLTSPPSADPSEGGDSATDVDLRAAAAEELTTTPAHVGDVVHSNPIPAPDPLSPQPDVSSPRSTSGGSRKNSGIQQSGAELGSFNSRSDATSPQPDNPAATTDNAASKGDL